MSAPHHHHQASLEGYIDFGELPPLPDDERTEARQRFYRICVHFETKHATAIASNPSTIGFSRPLLVKLTYEYSRSEISQDGFLRAFFNLMALPMRGDVTSIDLGDPLVEANLEAKVVEFGDFLMDNFYLPLKAAFGKTPRPSPASRNAVARIRASGQEFIGTPARLAGLREECLQRDRHRCVISRVFEFKEYVARSMVNDPVDDDGNLFPEDEVPTSLEVAHIIPHALLDSKDGILDERRHAAMEILNMFDQGVAHIINGVEIDKPKNAMSLTHDMHEVFGSFKVFFTPVDGQSHTYHIDSHFQAPVNRKLRLPVTRTLYLDPNHAIDPPSPRLLAVHRAIAHVLHLSGAGEYIDHILEDAEDVAVRSDGSTPLASLVNIGLSGLLRA